MKKIIVLLLLLTVSVAQAQKNQKAVALSDKLSKVMEFDEDQSTMLLELILDRNNKKRALRKEIQIGHQHHEQFNSKHAVSVCFHQGPLSEPSILSPLLIKTKASVAFLF